MLNTPREFSKYMYNKRLKDVGCASACVAEETMNRVAAEIAGVKKKDRLCRLHIYDGRHMA